ncbi:hypothetical protein KBX31_11630 [Liquorilactobacillus satsumensis]|uniref:hypothetical protein n=1 Tax=Liquorilactobacillus satsumensis TaxID=259059 RepID=UPI0021C267F9|nr:hypothetical protein [Liquorilactobacillus satsumensis]MCP9313903.1 hypothetical protein [Liquorilactobacillus satsumensis]MCP9327727.1 hypothetical protein [Liquorilactobacillus satsumensis]MCP9359698.1 hypothetical protein [Liquorilactobacillus satsumensis]
MNDINSELKKLVDNYSCSVNKLEDSNPYKDLFKKQEKVMKSYVTIQSPLVEFHVETGLSPGEIKLSQLNAVLPGAQKVLYSACNRMYGNAKDNGRIPSDIRKRNELIINSVKAGSFVVTLKKDAYDQLSLNNNELAWNEILSEILELLSSKSDTKIKYLAEKYGYRTYNASKAWINMLNKNDVSFKYNDFKENKKIELSKKDINHIAQNFDKVRLQHEVSEEEIVGQIVAISKDNVLILKTNRGDARIKVLDDSLDGSTIEFKGKDYNFKAKKEVFKDIRNNSEKVNYYMKSFEGF